KKTGQTAEFQPDYLARRLCRQVITMKLRFFALLFLAGAISLVQANSHTILMADAWLDVKSGQLNYPGNIVLCGSRISAINPDTLPEGVTVHLPGHTLLPGLIDCHTHLTRNIVPGWREQAVRESEADWALRGVANAQRTLLAGFTTVRDLGSYRFADLSLMRAIDRGWVDGPHMISCGHAICATGGHCDFSGYVHGTLVPRPEYGHADGVAEILKAVRYQIRMGARVIKVTASGGAMSDGTLEGNISQDELNALVQEAHRFGLRVAAHAHSSSSIKSAVKAGVDSIEHGFLIDQEAIDMMLAHGTWLVPTYSISHMLRDIELSPAGVTNATRLANEVTKRLRQAVSSGVKFAFGTDAAVLPHGRNAEEFGRLVNELGMTPLQALQSATINASDLLDLPTRGQLLPGYEADIVATLGNPLEDISLLEQIGFVMKSGRIYLQL
ncbi:amidohydrolase family protein, partial [Sansalvadorimonas sp. 2012CJ34-2]